jgi:hypothetical protein
MTALFFDFHMSIDTVMKAKQHVVDVLAGIKLSESCF